MSRYQVELVWNRDFHWSKFGNPEVTIEDAIKRGDAITNSGDGARVKKFRVIDNETGSIVYPK